MVHYKEPFLHAIVVSTGGEKIFHKWYGYKKYMQFITSHYDFILSSWSSRRVNMFFQLKKYHVIYYSMRSRGPTRPLLGYNLYGILNIL